MTNTQRSSKQRKNIKEESGVNAVTLKHADGGILEERAEQNPFRVRRGFGEKFASRGCEANIFKCVRQSINHSRDFSDLSSMQDGVRYCSGTLCSKTTENN